MFFQRVAYTSDRAPLVRVCFVAAHIHRSEAGYRLGSDRGSPNHGSTLLSKRVMAQIRSLVRVRTKRPIP
jgi:hypothetical protein